MLYNKLRVGILKYRIFVHSNSRMVKLLIIAAAIVAISHALPTEKRRVPMYKLLAPREPFPKSGESDAVVPSTIQLLSIEQRVDNFDPQNLATYEQVNTIFC